MLYLCSVKLLFTLFSAALLKRQAFAQFLPLYDANLTTLNSPHDPNITISYKVPEGACKTAFDTQKQYSGWVRIPVEDESTNLFFWFIEAREPTPALTIWLNGGAGGSSMSGFWQENGPCEVVEKDKDNLEVKAREWGWDRASNMLYIDLPSVGFSYTTPITNGSFDSYNATTIFPPEPIPEWSSPWAFTNGTFSIPNPSTNTFTAAHLVWNLLQAFLLTFPQYNPPLNSSTGISLFAKSTTAPYAPLFASYFHSQNLALSNSSLPSSVLPIKISAIGLINACNIDPVSQAQSYATMATNNSFNLPLLTTEQASPIMEAFKTRGGCSDLLAVCRSDNPTGLTKDDQIQVCQQAASCMDSLTFPYQKYTSRSLHDISNPSFDPLPNQTYLTYLNSLAFLSALGSPINFTDLPPAYPPLSPDPIPALTSLLSQGVRIAMISGDRDYLCNWYSTQSTALRLASSLPSYSPFLNAAGYAQIYSNTTYIGGAVRQFANLSFSRVYDAGHFPSYSQAETLFEVFARVVLGDRSLSTGEEVELGGTFATEGDPEATHTAELLATNVPNPRCYIRKAAETCDDESTRAVLRGEGVVINGVWYNSSDDWQLPGQRDGTSGQDPTTTAVMTGIFTTSISASTETANSAPVSRQGSAAYGLSVVGVLAGALLL
ncbi:Alpha/Beta hydrolase protein [Triangularia verruculosa]|uniref:Alpha/Beta hydrolase protein n=1 Tax=Triangularia verruculosa TaxID=2587418 RepID=A0AAN6X5X1_9PEZI|nr:Alpha/Beta hydrolase protein [Triangularia verruculosa]